MNKVKPIEALARKRGANELAIDLMTLGASSTSSLLYTGDAGRFASQKALSGCSKSKR